MVVSFSWIRLRKRTCRLFSHRFWRGYILQIIYQFEYIRFHYTYLNFGLSLRTECCLLLLGSTLAIQENYQDIGKTEIALYVISAFYFNGVVDQLEFNANFEKMVKINAIFATVALVSNFTILKKPDLTKEKIEIRDPIWISIYKICTNQEGLLDLLSVSSFIGLSWCYPMILFVLKRNYKLTMMQVQLYSNHEIYLTFIPSITYFFLLDNLLLQGYSTWQLQKQSNQGLQQEYDKYIKFTLGIGFLFLVVELLFFELMNVPILVIFNFVIGAGLGGIYSVLLESLMEKHFPVQELAIGSLLAAVACAESFIITMITIVPQILSYGFQISCFLMIPSFCYIIVFYSTSFKRFEFEA